jgi:ADP-heptose:LPS heptosyltransferase
VLEHLSLHDVTGALLAADLFIGHDSGMTHLAAAVGVPTLALFGPTEVSRWAPRGERVVTLSGASCRCQDWDAVQRCEAKPCLQIPLQQIFSACQRLLHGRARKPRELNAAPSSCYE